MGALCYSIACSFPFSEHSASTSFAKGCYTNALWTDRSYAKGSCAASHAEGLHAISNIADGKMSLMPHVSNYPVEASSSISSPQRVICTFCRDVRTPLQPPGVAMLRLMRI